MNQFQHHKNKYYKERLKHRWNEIKICYEKINEYKNSLRPLVEELRIVNYEFLEMEIKNNIKDLIGQIHRTKWLINQNLIIIKQISSLLSERTC